MSTDYYKIYVDNTCVAEMVPLAYASFFIEAIFSKLYNMTDLSITIKRMNLYTEECNE